MQQKLTQLQSVLWTRFDGRAKVKAVSTTFELLLKAKPWTLKSVENKRDQDKIWQ